MATLFRDKSKAEQLRAQNAADDSDWTYTVDQLAPGRPVYRVGIYDELGRFIGYL